MGKHKKPPRRGSGFSVSVPVEPMAGAAKNKPCMETQVQDGGGLVTGYPQPPGQSIAYRCGGEVMVALRHIKGTPIPDLVHITAGADNVEPITVEFEHALESAPIIKVLQPGQTLHANAVVSREWIMTAPTWE